MKTLNRLIAAAMTLSMATSQAYALQASATPLSPAARLNVMIDRLEDQIARHEALSDDELHDAILADWDSAQAPLESAVEQGQISRTQAEHLQKLGNAGLQKLAGMNQQQILKQEKSALSKLRQLRQSPQLTSESSDLVFVSLLLLGGFVLLLPVIIVTMPFILIWYLITGDAALA